MEEKHRKRFNQGDIVYWCSQNGHKYSVKYGMVDEEFSDAVYVDYIVPRERRLVNGIPIVDFTDDKYKKLPKGWNYNTRLYEITYEELAEEEKEFVIDIKNPENLRLAYEKGYFVKDKEIFHGKIDEEITKDGYRIVKRFPMFTCHIAYTTVKRHKLYFTYDEANKEVESNIKEFYRQANLSDYEWSVEQIDNTLHYLQGIKGLTDNEIKQYRDWILSLKNVEDIEVRLSGGNLQWKYWKNKKWNYIDL